MTEYGHSSTPSTSCATSLVVGDQSSGKSSVLESLAGINLPRGQGICTRVPLIMRLHNHRAPNPELRLECLGREVATDEAHVSEAINYATDEIAGNRKGISHTPLTLVMKKRDVPDLSMVDLPGITSVPVHGQPEDIYVQISNIIMEYINPKESIILNVLSANVDFTTCESIRMSHLVDKTGERTLAVVTKCDKAPEGLLFKVMSNDVEYWNRIGDESYEEARSEETKLFESHPLLCKIDKSIVGIPVLAQKLVQIQAASLAKCLPGIVKNINDKLSLNISELNKLPKNPSLRKIILRGEMDEYPGDEYMHCTAGMADKLNQYFKELQQQPAEGSSKFLMEEIHVLEEAKWIQLPNFLSRTAFLSLLQRKVKEISDIPIKFVEGVWSYVEDVVIRVLMRHSESYPQLQSCTRRAAQNLIMKIKAKSVDRVKEIVEMEMLTDYTCNPDYMTRWHGLMAQQGAFMQRFNDGRKPDKVNITGLGDVEIGHLRGHPMLVEQAFDMRMRITAYWEIVLLRLMEKEIMNELMGPHSHSGGIERMLEESPSVAHKRESLNRSCWQDHGSD
uniref:Dynamin-type G domain-containing protein n=1 Tax=Nelumbo nucifera TaxID=4432 RepID=A0A822YK25_NELNU|nr:TPA_asm: hypothetical protein HUJ06_010520 [Nelumbo nucifera]